MSTILHLRARAQRYRELASRSESDAGEALLSAADEIERQAGALEAYEAAARLSAPPVLSLSI